MKRWHNTDLLRGACILLIVVYHCYAVPNHVIPQYLGFVWPFFIFGGEIGVTLFFLLSGFGIYSSLANMNQQQGRVNYIEFLYKRIKRIYPQYMICIVVLLLTSANASFLSKNGIKHIISHMLMIHNIFPETHGTINGAAWAIGTIFQFYIIAPFIYKLLKKTWLIAPLAVLVTVLLKYVTYHFILFPRAESGTMYFIYGRQLLTALDNFIIGMLVAHTLRYKETIFVGFIRWGGFIVSTALCLAYLYASDHTLIYADNLYAYTWHSGLAIVLGIFLLFVNLVPDLHWEPISRPLLFISRREYGIYIWHMPMIVAMLQNSSAIKNLCARTFTGYTLVVTALCIVVGTLSTYYIDMHGQKFGLFLLEKNTRELIYNESCDESKDSGN